MTTNERKPLLATLLGEHVTVSESDEARELHDQSAYGSLLEDGKLQLSLLEALYLLEKGRIDVADTNSKKLDYARLHEHANKLVQDFAIRYAVFSDLRRRGYIAKTALKFGADFRVYDRGIKPGDDHAKWVVYPVHEGKSLTWYDFAAKNRVAHSTKKRLMIAVVDDERDVTYYEIRWMRP